MCYSRDAAAFSISTILPRLYQLLCNDRRGNRCVAGLAQRFDTSRVIGMQVCQHNQVYVCGGAMQETSEIINRQPYIEYGTRINDYTTFIVDKIGVCHREAVGDGMHLTDLLGKWRWLLPGLCSCIHGTSVTTFIVAQVKADRNPQDTISYHKIDPYASRCVILPGLVNVPEHSGSAPDTRKRYHYISGAARPTCSDRACPCQAHSQALVLLIPARGITTFLAQHGQHVVTGLAPVRIIHRPWLYYYLFTPRF